MLTRANGYAIGDYKKRPNMIGMYQTASPENVEYEMNVLIDWYYKQAVYIATLAEFHARDESIHPFQDGNGRTGRLILFRECLKNEIVPIVIEDTNRSEYLASTHFGTQIKSLFLHKIITIFSKRPNTISQRNFCPFSIIQND